jgi:type IV secretion system protein VirB6
MAAPAMNAAAPITWLIDRINVIVSTGSATVADAISGAVAPVASACFGIYLILITINYMRGAETDPVGDFIVRMAAWATIIGLGLNAGNYDTIIAPMVTGLGTDLAAFASGGTVSANSLDTLALAYLNTISTGFATASALSGFDSIGATLLVFAKTAIIVMGLVPFLVAAALAIIVANVGSQIIAMVGPLFFAFLLFPATRQYFSSWVSSALSYAFIPLIVAVVATIGVSISQDMIPSGSLDTATFTDVFLASIGNLILLFLLKSVSALASSLSAGGINMHMPAGIGTAARGAIDTGKAANSAGKSVVAGYRSAKNVANRFNSIRKSG